MHEEAVKRARILIVDDEEQNIRLLRRILERAGYENLTGTTDPREAVPLVRELSPDLILLDLKMPHLDGFGVLEQLRPEIGEDEYLPILVLTADVSMESRRRALTAGAKDFLTKPFDHFEVLLRIWNLLETRTLHLALRTQNADLEAKVRERTRDLEDAQIEILERLALAAEYRDDKTGQHTRRVAELSARIAEALDLPPDRVELIRRAALLHDVGKIGIPDAIHQKMTKLSEAETTKMEAHTLLGARILSGSRFPVLQLAEEIARTHHERWDGLGYPEGLEGESIPLVGRIVGVADAYDAMISERPYKDAWPSETAITELERQRGAQFDPRVVDAALTILRDEPVAADPSGGGTAAGEQA